MRTKQHLLPLPRWLCTISVAAGAALAVAACGGAPSPAATPTESPTATAGPKTTPTVTQASPTATIAPRTTPTSAVGSATATPTPTSTRVSGAPPTPTPTATPLPLTLAILEPADGAMVEQSAITIRGRTMPGATVSVNAELVEVDAVGNFSLTATLEEGPNVFAIFATDDVGNEATEEITVSYVP